MTEPLNAEELAAALRARCHCNIDSTPCGSEDECRLDIAAADAINALKAELSAATENLSIRLEIHHRMEAVVEAARGVISAPIRQDIAPVAIAISNLTAALSRLPDTTEDKQ